MISIEKRRATPHEVAKLSETQDHVAAVAIPAIVGSVFLSMPLGGAAALVVYFVTRSESLAAATAILAMIAIGLWNTRRTSRGLADEDKRLVEASERNRLEKSIDVVRVNNIVEAKEVLELEDFGPGLVLRTCEGEVVYCAGQVLEAPLIDDASETIPEDLEDTYAAEALVAECWSGTRELLNVRWTGRRIEITGFVEFGELGIEEWVGLRVLARGN